MGYRLNRLDVPVFIPVWKPLLAEFDIHQRLESYVKDVPVLALLLPPPPPPKSPAMEHPPFPAASQIQVNSQNLFF